MDYKWDSCKTQTLLKKEFLGKPQKQSRQNRALEEAEASRHSLIPRQINLKPHIKGLFTSIPIT